MEFIFSQGRQEYSKKIALKQCKLQGREEYSKKIALKQCKLQGREEYSNKIALKLCKSQGREGYIKKIALKQCKSKGRQWYSKKIALKMYKSHGRRGAIQPLTIVMRVADALREREWIDTYLIGGRVKPSGNITDVLSNESVRQFKFDISFATGGGISDEGIFVASPKVAAFGRAISAVSRRSIGIATHHSLGNDGFAKAGLIEDLDLLITDWDADPEAIERIRSLGVKVIVAQMEENERK